MNPNLIVLREVQKRLNPVLHSKVRTQKDSLEKSLCVTAFLRKAKQEYVCTVSIKGDNICAEVAHNKTNSRFYRDDIGKFHRQVAGNRYSIPLASSDAIESILKGVDILFDECMLYALNYQKYVLDSWKQGVQTKTLLIDEMTKSVAELKDKYCLKDADKGSYDF